MNIFVKEKLIDVLTDELYNQATDGLINDFVIYSKGQQCLAQWCEEGTYCVAINEFKGICQTIGRESGDTDYDLLQSIINELIDS